MEVTGIKFDPSTNALSMTWVPDPNNPEEKALMGCIYQFILAYPDDPRTAAKYSIQTARMLGFRLLPDGEPAPE